MIPTTRTPTNTLNNTGLRWGMPVLNRFFTTTTLMAQGSDKIYMFSVAYQGSDQLVPLEFQPRLLLLVARLGVCPAVPNSC